MLKQVLQERIDKLEVELNRSREERDRARKDLAVSTFNCFSDRVCLP